MTRLLLYIKHALKGCWVSIVSLSIVLALHSAAIAGQGAKLVHLSLISDFNKVLGVNKDQPVIVQKMSHNHLNAIRLDEGEDAIILHITLKDNQNHFLNIQDGPPVFSEIPNDWWSGQWLLKKQDDGSARLLSRWKQGLALGYDESGQVKLLRRDHPGTLWQIDLNSDENLTADKDAGASQFTYLTPEKRASVDEDEGLTDLPNHITIAAYHKNSLPLMQEETEIDKTVSSSLSKEDGQSDGAVLENENSKLMISSDLKRFASMDMTTLLLEDKSYQKGIVVEEIEQGIYRFTGQSDEASNILNIQNETLEATPIDPQWWSGQWVGTPAPLQGQVLRNRWKPEYILTRNTDNKIIVDRIDPSKPVSSLNENFYWYIASPKDVETIAESRMKPEMEREEKSADKLASTHLQKPENQAQLEKPANKQVRKKPAAPKANVKKKASKPRLEKQKLEMAKAKQEPIAAANEKAEEKASIFERIHGQATTNNNNTYSVGPWQAYTKLYANDLFGAGETIWILGDFFQWGDELRALRGGINLPLSKGSDWNFRYAGHFTSLNPYPVDKDYKWLKINESEHQLELYKVTSKQGHRNETGVFLNILNSDQKKLELTSTTPKDLGFSSRDLGLFTSGNFWKEHETYKDSGNYFLSLSAGINILDASSQFAVRKEASPFPLVIKGRASFTREWKETRTHFKASAAFQYADRVTEWHKHISLGGGSFVPGFPAAEVAGEIGAGASIEFGRTWEQEALSKAFDKPVRLTPYLRADAGFTSSLYDDPNKPMDYMRDAFLTSASIGARLALGNSSFDIAYNAPLTGKSRFDDAQNGRISISSTISW